MVGPAFKTMKSEFVAWQEAISAKKYDLHDEKQHDQPEGAFTQRNMNRSQQSWVKTFMQDVMDEKGQALFDNLAWFAKKLCSVMTSASACEHMWSMDTQQAQEPIGAAKCGESCSCPWQPRPQEGYSPIQTAESRMGLADTHQ